MQDHELVEVHKIQRIIVEECPRDIKDSHHHQIYHKGDYHTNLRAHMIGVKMGRVFSNVADSFLWHTHCISTVAGGFKLRSNSFDSCGGCCLNCCSCTVEDRLNISALVNYTCVHAFQNTKTT